MIEEPPLIQVHSPEKQNRPTAGQMARFRDVPTGNICDAMGGSGALSHEIRRMAGAETQLIGPAFTVDCGPGDILAFVVALTMTQPGDVFMLATGAWTGCAALGDLTSGMARNGGAAGIVTDGLVRDVSGIRATGLTVYAAGVTPNSPFSKGPGTIGFAAQIGGREVRSGDLVVGDADGVVVVSFQDIDAVADRLTRVRELEADLEAQVRDGLKAPPDTQALFDEGKVVIV